MGGEASGVAAGMLTLAGGITARLVRELIVDGRTRVDITLSFPTDS